MCGNRRGGIRERFRGRCGQCDSCIAVQSDVERHGDVEAGEQCGAYAWGTSMQLGMKRGMFEEAGNVMNAKLREFNTVKNDKNVLGMLRRNVM